MSELAFETESEPRTRALSPNIEAGLPRFGLQSFRPGQKDVIETLLSGRDVLCVMPTGGGKSLCYQLPALFVPAVTVVVSPLIALMKDQEDRMKSCGIPATAIHGGLELKEQNERLEGIANKQYKLVYVAPERLRSQRFVEMICKVGVSVLAVDEAHCISEWGHDFRPDYARLGWFRKQLGNPVTIALTATATDNVRRDISSQLGLNNPAVFVRGFDRPNLSYSVVPCTSKSRKLEALFETIERIDGSIIIYASTRKACEELMPEVAKATKRKTVIYHAGMVPEDRRKSQDLFMSSRADIVVATNAFGMGIDKSDIRGVIHYNIPATLEAYYQEAGRAGRDGKPAHCTLFFSYADRRIQEFFIDSEYPNAWQIQATLDFLRAQKGELIELTRMQIKEQLGSKFSELAVGACLKILESAGAVERLRPSNNLALIRLHETGPDLTDLLPRNATAQREVLRLIEKLVGNRRGEDCYLNPDTLSRNLGMERAKFLECLRELTHRVNLDYIPPFRGSATRLLDRTTPFQSLPIEFKQLEERKNHEYAKLERMCGYAENNNCRRVFLLEYFGDKMSDCGNCDNCDPSPPAAKSRVAVVSEPALKKPASERTTERDRTGDPVAQEYAGRGVALDGRSSSGITLPEAVRIVLSAVDELKGRFGKGLVCATLAGSTSKDVSRFGLQNRNCFAALMGKLKQFEIRDLIDSIQLCGLLSSQGDRMRPTVGLSPTGAQVLRHERDLPANLPITESLRERLEKTSSGSKVESTAQTSASYPVAPAEDERAPWDIAEDERTATSSNVHTAAAAAPKSTASSTVNSSPVKAAPREPQIRPSAPSTSKPAQQEVIASQPAGGSKQIVPDKLKPPSELVVPQMPTHYWTLRMVQGGMSVLECAAARNIPPTEIMRHLLANLNEGLRIPTACIPDQQFQGEFGSLITRLREEISKQRH